MPDLITAATSPNNCSHFIVDGSDDGVPWSGLQINDGELNTPLTTEEALDLKRLLLRYWRAKGIATIPALVGRVLRGEEATNMKVYDLIGKGVSITKTNVGTAYVNISPRLNGEREWVDFTGCTQFRLCGWANLAGAGPYNFRVVRDSDDFVIYESPNVAAGAERELDSNWQTIPAQISGYTQVRMQIKSLTGTDDPVVGGIQMAVK